LSAETPPTLDDTLTKVHEEYAEFLAGIEATFAKAEELLGLANGTLADAKNDNGFLAAMKISSTIEPLINDALSVEIRKLRKHKAESESETVLANFVNETNNRGKKVSLAKDLGIVSGNRKKFILGIFQLRDHYAHNIKNLHLDILEVIDKVAKEGNGKIMFHLAGIENTPANAARLKPQSIKTFMYWNFARFLSDALHVLKPPPAPVDGLYGLLSQNPYPTSDHKNGS